MEINSQSTFDFNVILNLKEQEARALYAITEYGLQAFTEVFYAKLGKEALKPHEKGLESLFETIKKELPPHLRKMNKVREIWRMEV